jgi:hypothetical protein
MVLATAALASACAFAQQTPAQYPVAAARFLDGELPKMEIAVAERDRDYFEAAMGRTVAFSEDWGFKSRANPHVHRRRVGLRHRRPVPTDAQRERMRARPGVTLRRQPASMPAGRRPLSVVAAESRIRPSAGPAASAA